MKKTSIIVAMLTLCSWSVLASTSKVDTFNTTPTTISMCEITLGSGMASFDLTSVEGDITTVLPNIAFEWYTDSLQSDVIANPSSYMSGDATVYVRVFSTLDTVTEASEEVSLVVFSLPDLSYLDAVGDTICGRRPIRLGNPTGPDIEYTWSPADFLSSDTVSNPIFTPVAGTDNYSYTVAALDPTTMCMAQEMLNFIVLDADLEITYENEVVDVVEVCKGDGMVTLGVNSSEDVNQVVWSSSRDTLSDLMGPMTTIDAELSTYIYATQTFPNGCVLVDTVLIRVDSLPRFDISVIPAPNQPCDKYCPGQVVTLVTNAPDLACFPDAEYFWSPPGDIVGSDTNLNVALMVTNGNTQLYTRLARNHACVEIDTHTVGVVDTIPPILGIPDKICPGDQFELWVDTTYLPDFSDYQWDTSDDDQVMLSCGECPNTPRVLVTISEDARGSFTISVTGTKEMCCSATGYANINIPIRNIPLIDTLICVGLDVQLEGNPDLVNYNWMAPGLNIDNSQIFNPTFSGFDNQGTFTVTVEAEDTDGCPYEGFSNITAFFEPIPINDTIICLGSSVQLVGPTALLNYNWTAPNGISIDNRNISNPTLSGFPLGTTIVMVTAEDAEGCQHQESISITVSDEVPIGIADQSICVGEALQINGPVDLLNYNWMAPGNINIDNNTISSPTFTGFNVGTTLITVTAEDAGGCSYLDSIIVTVTDERQIGLPDQFICVGQSLPINGPVDLVNYAWSSSSAITITNGNTASPTFSGFELGTTQITVTAEENGGCQNVDTIIVTATIQQLVLGDLNACFGGTVTQNSPANLTNFNWTVPVGLSIDDAQIANPTFSGFTQNSYVVSVSAEDETGCLMQGNVTINVSNAFPPSIDDVELCPESRIGVVGDETYTDYNWTVNEVGASLEDAQSSMPTVVLSDQLDTNRFQIYYTAVAPDGCSVNDSITVNVSAAAGCEPIAPNVFAPSDQLEDNKRFQPIDEASRNPIPGERILDFKIWNRWGQKVYDNDSNDIGWDGRQNGDPAPSDVYLYIIEVLLEDGNTKTLSGDVTLLR